MIDSPNSASERALIKAAVEHSLRGESSYRLLVPGSDPEVWVVFGDSRGVAGSIPPDCLEAIVKEVLEAAALVCDAKVAQLQKLGAQQNQIGTAQVLAESIRALKGSK